MNQSLPKIRHAIAGLGRIGSLLEHDSLRHLLQGLTKVATPEAIRCERTDGQVVRRADITRNDRWLSTTLCNNTRVDDDLVAAT